MKEREFVLIGCEVYCLTQEEIALVKQLYKENHLKWEPKIISIYGYERGERE